MSLTGQCPRRAGMAGTSANFTSRAGPAIGSSCHLRRVQVPCRFDGPYDALARRDRVVALYSAAYFDRSRYTTNEWVVALLFTDENRDRLIPVRVADVPPELIPPLLKPILYRDIFGMGQTPRGKHCSRRSQHPAQSAAIPVTPASAQLHLGYGYQEHAAGPETSGQKPWVYRPRRPPGHGTGEVAGRGPGGRAGTAWHGRRGQDPARDRVRAPLRRLLRPDLVDRLRASTADRRPVHRPGLSAQLRPGRRQRRGSADSGAERPAPTARLAADLRQRRAARQHRRLA